MAKIPYTNLKLKLNTDVNTFVFNDKTIEVLKYLPVQDKYDLLTITLQKSAEDGYYNPLKIDVYFHLHLVYMYTNITFTDKQREDEFKLYDTLMSNGFFDQFLEAMEEEEYNDMCEKMDVLESDVVNYNTTAASILKTFVTDLPKNAEAAKQIVDSFDKEQYKAVIDFANAANGNRNFKTNEPV